MLHVAHNQVACVLAAHGLFQKHLEVLPLDGTGVLKLIYHHVVQLGAYLLKDKWGVAVLNQGVEQGLRVTEQEAVGLLVQLSHLLVDATQQAQLVEMLHR